MVDFLVVFVLLMSALWGYLRGILHGVLSLVCLVGAYLGSAALGPSFGRIVAGWTDWSETLAYLAGRIAAGVLIYVSLSISAAVADRRFGRTERGVVRRWNRNWGAVGGLLSGALLVLIGLFVIDSLLKAFPESEGAMAQAARKSFFRRTVSGSNPADRFLVTDTIRLLRAARQDPEVLERLRDHPEVRPLVEHPTVRAVAEDQQLADDLREGRIGAVLDNPNVRRLLGDRDLRRKVSSPELREALRQAVAASEEGEGEEPPPEP